MAKRDYPVGRGQPPKHSQFRKGTSGNPAGRPRGSRDMRGLILTELQSLVTAKENGRTVRVSKGLLVIKAMIAKAAAGDMRTAVRIADLMLKLDRSEPKAPEPDIEELAPEDAEIIAAFLARARKGGSHD